MTGCGHREAGYNVFGWGCQPCGVSASFPTVRTGPGWQDYAPLVLSRRSRMRAWLNRLRRALAGEGGLVRS